MGTDEDPGMVRGEDLGKLGVRPVTAAEATWDLGAGCGRAVAYAERLWLVPGSHETGLDNVD